MASTIAVKIRYPDFSTHTRQTTIPPTAYDDEIIRVVRDLFKQLYDERKSVRLIGVRFSGLVDPALQTNLFENRVRKSSLYDAIDDLKKRFGKGSVERGK